MSNSFHCLKCDLGSNLKAIGGFGNIKGGLFFISESPDLSEAEAGTLLVGKSGKIFNLFLDKAGINKDNVFYCNIVCCHQSRNSKPMPDEVMTCSRLYLEKYIQKGKPKVVVALGSTAINYFTGIRKISIAREKKLIKLPDRDFVVIPTYHPSYFVKQGDDVNLRAKEEIASCVEDYRRALKAWTVFKIHKLI